MAYNYRSLFLTFLETVKVQDLEASTAGSGESPLSVSDGQLLIISSRDGETVVSPTLPLLIRALFPSWGFHPHDLIQI